MTQNASSRQDGPLDELLAEMRAFLAADGLDRQHFLRLVELLHDLPAGERRVAYDHLMHETTHATMSSADDTRVRLLGRLADLVQQDPPALGTAHGPATPAAVGRAGPASST